ncbi:MAG TPA: LemA family protein [Thermodesulfatator sp.]|nr:LemA family protein [Thermodesulfatator sp.]
MSLTLKRALSLIFFFLMVSGLSSCGYNQIQKNDEAVKKAWADLQAALQRRHDLIPNLVEVVKAYAKHERQTLEAVTRARAQVGQIQLSSEITSDPKAMARLAEAEGQLSAALSRLLMVVEKYPELRSSDLFRDLLHQLEGTENRINVARIRYNRAVERFNVSIRIFPNNLTNRFLLHYSTKEPFQAPLEAQTAPKVKFD